MARNIWTQRLIVLLDSVAFGFIADRVFHNPLWGIATGLVSFIVVLLYLRRKPLAERMFKLEKSDAQLLRTILLSLAFFALSPTFAMLIVSCKRAKPLSWRNDHFCR